MDTTYVYAVMARGADIALWVIVIGAGVLLAATLFEATEGWRWAAYIAIAVSLMAAILWAWGHFMLDAGM